MGLLFFALTPGVLVRLPKGCGRLMTAVTHAALFVLIFCVTRPILVRMEGFQGTTTPTMPSMQAMPSMPVMATQPPKPQNAPIPMPAATVLPSVSLAPMNISLSSSGTGTPGTVCTSGNDCAKGICMSGACA